MMTRACVRACAFLHLHVSVRRQSVEAPLQLKAVTMTNDDASDLKEGLAVYGSSRLQ